MNRATTKFWCGNRLVQGNLSIFFYAKQFRVQQFGYEKLKMNKRLCKELILSLSFSLSETVNVKKRTCHC